MIYKYIYRTCPFPLVRMNYFNGIISIIKIGKELKGKKMANNMQWADWKTIAAKMLFELVNKEGASDVWN